MSIELTLVDGAWSHFLRGDQVAYARSIADTIEGARRLADVVVLAQASMAPAAELLAHLGVEVLSSPKLGVRRIVEQLRAGGDVEATLR